MNRRIESKFGLIEINENISGLGYDLFLEGQFMQVYIGDYDNDAEIINVISTLVDGPKTDKEKRQEDGIIQMVISKETIEDNIDEWVKTHLRPSFKFRKYQRNNESNKSSFRYIRYVTFKNKSSWFKKE